MRILSGEAVRERVKQAVLQTLPIVEQQFPRMKLGVSGKRIKERLEEILRRVDRPLQVGIIGEFRAGKSSLINALARARVALTDEIEATATLNRYYYSEVEHAVIVYHDRPPERTNIVQALQILDRQRYDRDFLERIKQVDFGFPIPFLKEMELWDTPGLGGSQFNTSLAEAFSQSVDAIIWVFDANTIGRMDASKVLNDVGAQNKLVIGVLNKSENLSEQEFRRARNFLREIHPYVNFAEILPFSALLAMYDAGIVEEEPLVLGSVVAADGGREQLLQVIRERLLLDPRRVVAQSVVSDCALLFYEVADDLHMRLLQLQRRKWLYSEGCEKSDKIVDVRFDDMQKSLSRNLEAGLRDHLSRRLEHELSMVANVEEAGVFEQVMKRVLDPQNVREYLENLLFDLGPHVRQIVHDLGLQCDEALDKLLSPVERIDFRTEVYVASGGSKQDNKGTVVVSSIAALVAGIFTWNPFVIPLVWVVSLAAINSLDKSVQEPRSKRQWEGERIIRDFLPKNVLPHAEQALQQRLREVEQSIRTAVQAFWRQRVLGNTDLSELKTLEKQLHDAYQHFYHRAVLLEQSCSSHAETSMTRVAKQFSVSDSDAVRKLIEAILDEGRRLLWVLDWRLEPRVLHWLENAHPAASLRILTAESHLNDTSVLLFEQAILTLRQNRSGAVNMGILRDTRINIDRSAPPFSGSWLLTERGSYYFSIPLSEVLSRSRDFDFETVTSDTAPARRVTAETFEKWWFNRDRNLPMLPVFLKEQESGEQGTTT